MSKRVQFSCDIKVESTFANEDYDRTAQEVAKLTYRDMVELLQMKSQWRREMEKMMTERANREEQQQQQQQEMILSSSPEETRHQQQQASVFAHEICT